MTMKWKREEVRRPEDGRPIKLYRATPDDQDVELVVARTPDGRWQGRACWWPTPLPADVGTYGEHVGTWTSPGRAMRGLSRWLEAA